MSRAPRVLVVDNYDSFVYNLVQFTSELGALVTVRRNDEVDVEDLAAGDFDGVLISPGPGHPRDAGNVIELIRYCASVSLPLFGVCLGHQALGEAFGAQIVKAPELFHGRSSVVAHEGVGVFRGVSSPVIAGRYHSLVVEAATLPANFEVTAWCDGLIMGMRHRRAPLEGVQFHPESVLTQDGYLMIANWLSDLGWTAGRERAEALAPAMDLLRSSLPRPAR